MSPIQGSDGTSVVRPRVEAGSLKSYELLGGSGGLSKEVNSGIARLTFSVLGVVNLLKKSPRPSEYSLNSLKGDI